MSAAATTHPSALYRVVIKVIKSVNLTPLSLAASPGRVGALLRVAEISLAVGQVPATWLRASIKAGPVPRELTLCCKSLKCPLHTNLGSGLKCRS